MSHAGAYYKTGMSLFKALDEGKPHTSITDWIEVLSSDRYDELSLDGIPELVESINILGGAGTAEGARAIRKKLKYGNVHRQIRALVILRALTENAGKGFKLNWADDQMLSRLREMAQDSLLDPKVKKRLILVFHAWSIQYADEPRMRTVAGLYKQYAPHASGPDVRRATQVPQSRSSAAPVAASKPRGAFDDDIYNHSWAPAPGQRGKDTYADLAAARADAEQRRVEREARLAIEQREAEVERREREMKRKQEMAAVEARRQREAEEEAVRRRKMKEDAARMKSQPPQAKKPKFDLQREKPQIMVSVANALQAATALVAACRHINREYENVTESPKVQDCLDKAKAARRVVIRYLQLVQDETIVGTLIEANEKIVEAIQLYDKLSKPAILDSDDEGANHPPAQPIKKEPTGPSEMEMLTRRMEAQKLEADRRGEIQRLEETQKRESAKQKARQAAPPPRSSRSERGAHPDLQDLDFGSISSKKESSRLPRPISPDSDAGSFRAGSLSDFSDYSDYGYDSSDPEDRRGQRSRRPSHAQGSSSRAQSRRSSVQYGASGSGSGSGGGTQSRSRRQSMKQEYRSLEEDGNMGGRKRLLDPNDPFGDPFADDETPQQERPRMQWAEI